jgi:peptide deformylase
MKTLTDLLLLGDPRLYETCEPIEKSELGNVATWVADLHNVMEEIRAKYNFGRAIAAPQLGHCETARLYEYCPPGSNLKPKLNDMRQLRSPFRRKLATAIVMTDDLSELQHEIDHLTAYLYHAGNCLSNGECNARIDPLIISFLSE